MRSYTLQSKKHGPVVFTADDGPKAAFVWCSINGGKSFQPIKDGYATGTTLKVGPKESLTNIARTWWTNYLRKQRSREGAMKWAPVNDRIPRKGYINSRYFVACHGCGDATDTNTIHVFRGALLCYSCWKQCDGGEA